MYKYLPLYNDIVSNQIFETAVIKYGIWNVLAQARSQAQVTSITYL